MRFIHLHLHTQYSLLDGAIRVSQLPAALAAAGFDACAITDHGNLFGAQEFSQAMQKANLKPIIGMGVYVIPPGVGGGDPLHLTLLCRERRGYQNLIRLASLGYLEGKRGSLPCVSQDTLAEHREGLIALSAYQEGILAAPLLAGDLRRARREAAWYGECFADNFYVELQAPATNAHLPSQKNLNQKLIELAGEHRLPLVGTNDCHYLKAEEAEAHHVLQLMGKQLKMDKAHPFIDRQLHLKTAEEMLTSWGDLPREALENTAVIADACDFAVESMPPRLPRFEVPQPHDETSWFTQEAQRGLAERLRKIARRRQWTPEHLENERPRYQERLEHEIATICQMDYAGYFLIVADFIRWAKQNGVTVGPGRGSGAGSLTAYALGITELDPLEHGLLFERFLNPERVSLPDFDIDFDGSGRDRVIAYVRDKYGANRVCQISTFGSLKAKAVLRGVARVLNLPYSQADRIAKLVPNKIDITLQQAFQEEPELEAIKNSGDEHERRLLAISAKLEGLNSNLSTHAAGVIISDRDLLEVLPLCVSAANDEPAQQMAQSMYSMASVEQQGAVKFDFLGLRNLSVITDSLTAINAQRRPEEALELDDIPLDDKTAYALISSGKTLGIFQLESEGMTRMIVELAPDHFEELVASLALYRPGPLKEGMTHDYIRRKHRKARTSYLHAALKDVLRETNGVMIYQEQVMEAARVMGGFSLGEADLLRRAMGKKKPEEMQKQKARFITGCRDNGISGSEAGSVFEKIDAFSGYGFNKSHSAAYALIAYHTAYLKAHYPLEFMSALLSADMDNADKVAACTAACREMGLNVLPPDINASEYGFSIDTGEAIPTGSSATGDSVARDSVARDSAAGTGAASVEGGGKAGGESVASSARGAQTERQRSPRQRPLQRGALQRRSLRFGLGALKNVGQNAIEVILRARVKEHQQRFQSLEDFLLRVDLHRVNRRVFEALVKCGAFDSLCSRRSCLMQGVEEAHQQGLQHQHQQSAGQESLIGMLNADEAEKAAFQLELPSAPPLLPRQRLQLEKETLGFYVSGHPLDVFASELRNWVIRSDQMGQSNEGESQGGEGSSGDCYLAGVIIEMTERIERESAKRWAIATVEDRGGTFKALLFADCYATLPRPLAEGETIVLRGKVRRFKERTVVAQRVICLETFRAEQAQTMHIDLASNGRAESMETHLDALKGVLVDHPAKANGTRRDGCQLGLRVRTSEGAMVEVNDASAFHPTPDCVHSLQGLLGDARMRFTYRRSLRASL